MFVCSMDHSPSEQIHEPAVWHTTVLVLSEGAAQWDAAGDIAGAMRIQGGRLKKWSRYSDAQKAAFATALHKRISAKDLTIAAVTARATTIRAVFEDLVAQLGLAQHAALAPEAINGKEYIVWGPLIKYLDGKLVETFLPVIETRFVPLIFIVHFMCRMHQALLEALQAADSRVTWLDWQVSADKFVGDIDGQMSQAFYALLNLLSQSQTISGNLRDLTFLDSDEGSDLADNIAGMLRDKMDRGGEDDAGPSENFAIGGFYWEIWRPTPTM